MYSNQTVLKAANLYPSVEVKPTYNVNGEPAPRRGYFNKENAEAMDQVI